MSKNSDNSKIKKKFNFKNSIIFFLILAYCIMFIHTFFSQNVDTVVLTSGIIEEVDKTDGIITRSESVISSDVSGILYPKISPGDRVSKGQVVAVVKNEQVKEVEKKIEELNEKIDKLTVPSFFNNDIKLLESEISEVLTQVIKSDYYKTFTKVSGYKTSLDTKIQKKAKIIGNESPIGSVAQNYITQLEKYESELNKVQAEIVSPIAGTVVYKLDGYEEILTADAISLYDTKTLDKLNIPKGELIGTLKDNSLKIVDNIEGYITVILNSENARQAQVDQKVELRFPEIDNNLKIIGRIDYMNLEQNGNVVITFRVNRAIETLLNYRKVKVDVIWKTTEGYKVPTSAILKNENENKVYILAGRSYVVEKIVEIKEEVGDYAIINGTEGNKLYLYDSIIVDASNVNFNKMLH